MVDNFDQIKGLLEFSSDDDFYFCQILKRKKENPELGSNSAVIKTYFIKSKQELDFNRPEMIALAVLHNARVCINLNKRSFERTAFHSLKKITDQIMNKDFVNVRKAYNSVCGMYSSDEDRKWIIDIDKTGRSANDLVREIEFRINKYRPLGIDNKLLSIIQTKNGIHMITSPFDLHQFKIDFPDVDVHKNNPTILYIP